MRQSPIHSAVRRIARTLAEMEIPFAIAGALAANAHGHVRTTEVVDILLQPQGLHDFKQAWLGRGYGDDLTPYVQHKYDELWLAAQHEDEY